MNFTHTCVHHLTSAAPETPIVFIDDGDGSTRETLESVICAAGWQAMTAASAGEFLAQPRATAPCCLLVEQHLPGSSGLDLQEILRARKTNIPILVLTGHGDVPMAVEAMRAGRTPQEACELADGEIVERAAFQEELLRFLDEGGIADEGGALMVDPRSDNEIRDALESRLTDDALYARLLDEAKNRSTRTWEQYAAETWSFLVEGHTA